MLHRGDHRAPPGRSSSFRTGDPASGDGTRPHTLLRATDPALGLDDRNRIPAEFFAEGGVFDQSYRPGR